MVYAKKFKNEDVGNIRDYDILIPDTKDNRMSLKSYKREYLVYMVYNPNSPLPKEDRDRIKEIMKDNVIISSVIVNSEIIPGKLFVIDGDHRVVAAILKNLPIPYRVINNVDKGVIRDRAGKSTKWTYQDAYIKLRIMNAPMAIYMEEVVKRYPILRKEDTVGSMILPEEHMMRVLTFYYKEKGKIEKVEVKSVLEKNQDIEPYFKSLSEEELNEYFDIIDKFVQFLEVSDKYYGKIRHYTRYKFFLNDYFRYNYSNDKSFEYFLKQFEKLLKLREQEKGKARDSVSNIILTSQKKAEPKYRETLNDLNSKNKYK